MTPPEPDEKGGGVAGIQAEGTACAKRGNVHCAAVSEEPWAVVPRSDHELCVQNRGWGLVMLGR